MPANPFRLGFRTDCAAFPHLPAPVRGRTCRASGSAPLLRECAAKHGDRQQPPICCIAQLLIEKRMTPTLRPAVENRGIKVSRSAGGVAGVFGLVLALNACGGGLGCRLRSVEKAAYVARNDAVLRTVPVYPGSKLLSDESPGMHASNSCGPS
jgi:hypothetical protein